MEPYIPTQKRRSIPPLPSFRSRWRTSRKASSGNPLFIESSNGSQPRPRSIPLRWSGRRKHDTLKTSSSNSSSLRPCPGHLDSDDVANRNVYDERNGFLDFAIASGSDCVFCLRPLYHALCYGCDQCNLWCCHRCYYLFYDKQIWLTGNVLVDYFKSAYVDSSLSFDTLSLFTSVNNKLLSRIFFNMLFAPNAFASDILPTLTKFRHGHVVMQYLLYVASVCGRLRLVKLLMSCTFTLDDSESNSRSSSSYKSGDSSETATANQESQVANDSIAAAEADPGIDTKQQQCISLSTHSQQALRLAVRHGRYRIASLLLQYPEVNPTPSAVHPHVPPLALAAKLHDNARMFDLILSHLIRLDAVREAVEHYQCLSLYNAVQSNNLKVVERLLSLPDCIPRAADHRTVLAAACGGHFEILKRLYELKATQPNHIGLTGAARGGYLNCVKLLVEHGSNPATQSNLALKLAADEGHVDVVNYLLSLKNLGVDASSSSNAPLCRAAMNGHLSVVKILVSEGVDVEFPQNRALQFSSENGHVDVVRFLLQQGIQAGSRGFDSALIAAARKGYLEILQILLQICNDTASRMIGKALEESMHYDRIECAGRLLQLTWLPTHKVYLERAFRLGCMHSSVQLLQMLMNSTAMESTGIVKVHTVFKDDGTTRSLKIYYDIENLCDKANLVAALGSEAKVELLLTEFCEQLDSKHRNAMLSYAARNNHLSVVSFMLSDPNVGDFDGTIILQACNSGHVEVMQELLKRPNALSPSESAQSHHEPRLNTESLAAKMIVRSVRNCRVDIVGNLYVDLRVEDCERQLGIEALVKSHPGQVQIHLQYKEVLRQMYFFNPMLFHPTISLRYCALSVIGEYIVNSVACGIWAVDLASQAASEMHGIRALPKEVIALIGEMSWQWSVNATGAMDRNEESLLCSI